MAILFKNHDGMNVQAQAVKAYLSGHDGLEPSWSKEKQKYMVEPEIYPWYNGREKGYVVCVKIAHKQLNIAFFEHRNSDAICAIKFEVYTFDPPTPDDIPKTAYKDKWDVSHTVAVGCAEEMARWIYEEMNNYVKNNIDFDSD